MLTALDKTNRETEAPPGLAWEEAFGWAETRRTRSLVARPASVEECLRVIRFARSEGLTICPRGGGYSYADMILNDGQILLDTCRMDRILRWDEKEGVLTVEPGVTLGQMLRRSLPAGWTIPASVGGLGLTAAGGVSNNVHGKDCWKLGNFGEHVLELKLLTAEGQILEVSRRSHPELFRAVVGGMGLLGVIVEMTFRLQRVPSPFVEVENRPARSLKELLEIFEASLNQADFAVAWVDAFAAGNHLGRGFVTTARWVESDRKMDEQEFLSTLEVPSRLFGVLPARATWKAFRPFYGPALVRRANAVQHWMARSAGRTRRRQLFTDYNFMHNRIPHLKEIYRPHGLLEFQPLIPRENALEGISEIFRLCQREGTQSLLCGLKLHRSDDFFLSYSGAGYSFGIDVARRGRDPRRLDRFARGLYEKVIGLGGRIYLAKDELLPRDIFKRMYPAFPEFLRIKRSVDPEGLFASDMYRRLMD